MDILLLVARLLHIGLGVFWVGTMLFNAFFLGPALQDVGPDAAKVGAALMKRGMMTFMPIAALLTILSGLWLYWRMSGGFTPAYMASRQGQTLGVGAAAALIGFGVGLTLVRPAMTKAGMLGQRAAQTSGPERDTLVAQAQRVRLRADAAGRWVTGLLIVALVAMAVARYL